MKKAIALLFLIIPSFVFANGNSPIDRSTVEFIENLRVVSINSYEGTEVEIGNPEDFLVLMDESEVNVLMKQEFQILNPLSHDFKDENGKILEPLKNYFLPGFFDRSKVKFAFIHDSVRYWIYGDEYNSVLDFYIGSTAGYSSAFSYYASERLGIESPSDYNCLLANQFRSLDDYYDAKNSGFIGSGEIIRSIPISASLSGMYESPEFIEALSFYNLRQIGKTAFTWSLLKDESLELKIDVERDPTRVRRNPFFIGDAEKIQDAMDKGRKKIPLMIYGVNYGHEIGSMENFLLRYPLKSNAILDREIELKLDTLDQFPWKKQFFPKVDNDSLFLDSDIFYIAKSLGFNHFVDFKDFVEIYTEGFYSEAEQNEALQLDLQDARYYRWYILGGFQNKQDFEMAVQLGILTASEQSEIANLLDGIEYESDGIQAEDIYYALCYSYLDTLDNGEMITQQDLQSHCGETWRDISDKIFQVPEVKRQSVNPFIGFERKVHRLPSNLFGGEITELGNVIGKQFIRIKN